MYLQNYNSNVFKGPKHMIDGYNYLLGRTLASRCNPDIFSERVRELYFDILHQLKPGSLPELNQVVSILDEENIAIIMIFFKERKCTEDEIDEFIAWNYNLNISPSLDVWVEEELQRQGFIFTGRAFRDIAESRFINNIDRAQNILLPDFL